MSLATEAKQLDQGSHRLATLTRQFLSYVGLDYHTVISLNEDLPSDAIDLTTRMHTIFQADRI